MVDENGEEIVEGVEAEEKEDICPDMDVIDGTEDEEFHTSPSTPVNQTVSSLSHEIIHILFISLKIATDLETSTISTIALDILDIRNN